MVQKKSKENGKLKNGTISGRLFHLEPCDLRKALITTFMPVEGRGKVLVFIEYIQWVRHFYSGFSL